MGKKASGLAPPILALDPLDILPWLDAVCAKRPVTSQPCSWKLCFQGVAIQLGFWPSWLSHLYWVEEELPQTQQWLSEVLSL